MSNSVKMSIAGAVVIIALLLAVLPSLLRSVNGSHGPAGSNSTAGGPANSDPADEQGSAAAGSAGNSNAGLPVCPTATGRASQSPEPAQASKSDPLSGIRLDCLGAPGTAIELANALQGKPTVINVWAWNCAPCRNELPLFDALSAKRPDLTVAGVHENADAKRGIEFAKSVNLAIPSWLDNDGRFAAALELPNVVPQTVVLRADGTVAAKFPKTFTSVSELEHTIDEALQ